MDQLRAAIEAAIDAAQAAYDDRAAIWRCTHFALTTRAAIAAANTASAWDEAGRLRSAAKEDRERVCAVEIGVLAHLRAAEAAISAIA